ITPRSNAPNSAEPAHRERKQENIVRNRNTDLQPETVPGNHRLARLLPPQSQSSFLFSLAGFGRFQEAVGTVLRAAVRSAPTSSTGDGAGGEGRRRPAPSPTHDTVAAPERAGRGFRRARSTTGVASFLHTTWLGTPSVGTCGIPIHSRRYWILMDSWDNLVKRKGDGEEAIHYQPSCTFF
ncbi:unnamed protein product, partial [Urochloa humidicola]